MKIAVGKYYKLRVNIFGRIEDYEGRVLSKTKDEFRFETEDDNTCRALTLRNSEVVFMKEIAEPEREQKSHFISQKKQFKNLKPSVEPEF